MQEEMLRQVREEYKRLEEEKEIQMEFTNLCESKEVKRFLELSNLIDKNYIVPSEETMIRRAYESVPSIFKDKNINSNQIMIFMGSYIKKDNTDCMTYERDPNTNYKTYMDLETEERYSIDKEKCLDFEKKYITLYLPISEYSEEEYFKAYCALQKWFGKQLLYRDQTKVIEELRKEYARKYIEFFPHFEEINEIAGLPIDKWVKEYPEDGFIENNMIDHEKRMVVKLYRKQIQGNQ